MAELRHLPIAATFTICDYRSGHADSASTANQQTALADSHSVRGVGLRVVVGRYDVENRRGRAAERATGFP